MYLVKVVVQGVGETILFRFKEESLASTRWQELEEFRYSKWQNGDTPSDYLVADDYGLTASLAPYSVLMVTMLDLDKTIEGDTLIQLRQQTVQQKIVAKAQAGGGIIAAPADVLNGFPRRQ